MILKVLTYYNFITNIFLLSIFLGAGVILADTNGVWHFPEDIRSGTFGLDENANISNNYTFINNVKFNKSVFLNPFSDCSIGTNENNTITCSTSNVDKILQCYSEGKLWNGSQCISGAGIITEPIS